MPSEGGGWLTQQLFDFNHLALLIARFVVSRHSSATEKPDKQGGSYAYRNPDREEFVALVDEARGLRVEGTDFVYLAEGAYAVVFVDRVRRRVRKIYRVRNDVTSQHCDEVFKAETRAYELASGAEELRSIIPTYHGACESGTIVDGRGANVSSEFRSDLCFEAEFVDCSFEKVGSALESKEFESLLQLFLKNGIAYVTDASVCTKDGRVSKVIDFATHEIELWWE